MSITIESWPRFRHVWGVGLTCALVGCGGDDPGAPSAEDAGLVDGASEAGDTSTPGDSATDSGVRARGCHTKNVVNWSMTVSLSALRQDILPLPMETGQALADYLQHERPTTRHPALFVRCRDGRDQPITSTAIQKVIKRACRRIGLAHSSAHALRHTLACRLVESGSSLKEVADVLRHRSLNTTLIYTKLDTPQLSAVPLPWPGSGS